MLIISDEIYEILGIDRDADTKTIKKAYAKLIKQYHPEENPKEWQRIHDAYELAIKIASAGEQTSSEVSERQAQSNREQVPIAPEGTTGADTYALSEEQESELESLFGDVEETAHMQWEEDEKAKKQNKPICVVYLFIMNKKNIVKKVELINIIL